MNYYYKDIDFVDDKLIEVVASDATLGLLKAIGNENTKVCLDINNQELVNKLKKIVSDKTTIKVWSSYSNKLEYQVLLFICYLFKNNNIQVIMAEDINKEAISMGSISRDEIDDIDSKFKILTKEDKEHYYSEYVNRIENENNL